MKTIPSVQNLMALNIVPAIVLSSTLFPAQPASAATVTKCGQYDSVSITPSSNIYRVNNNIWNDPAGSQCIQVNEANGAFSVTSSTHNKPTNGAPASYTFIDKGCHWGACTNSARSGMPKRVGALLNVTSNWSTAQPASGVYNVAYDIWFNTTATTGGQPNGAELMIWLAYKGGIQPVGSLIAAAVPLAGATWDVWGGWNNGAKVISYVRTSNTASVCNFNLKGFINNAVARGYIQTDWYLIAVEAGFEIWQNGAGLESKAFTVLVE